MVEVTGFEPADYVQILKIIIQFYFYELWQIYGLKIGDSIKKEQSKKRDCIWNMVFAIPLCMC